MPPLSPSFRKRNPVVEALSDGRAQLVNYDKALRKHLHQLQDASAAVVGRAQRTRHACYKVLRKMYTRGRLPLIHLYKMHAELCMEHARLKQAHLDASMTAITHRLQVQQRSVSPVMLLCAVC